MREPNYEGREGTYDWAGPWRLDRRDMTWKRPQYFYMRSAVTSKVKQFEQPHHGPMVRPGPLRDVVRLDVPHAVLRSHPSTPGALPPDLEGMWIDTNPAWPEMSIDHKLGKLGLLASWEDSSADNVETFNPEEFDVDGFDGLEALVVYVRMRQSNVA